MTFRVLAVTQASGCGRVGLYYGAIRGVDEAGEIFDVLVPCLASWGPIQVDRTIALRLTRHAPRRPRIVDDLPPLEVPRYYQRIDRGRARVRVLPEAP